MGLKLVLRIQITLNRYKNVSFKKELNLSGEILFLIIRFKGISFFLVLYHIKPSRPKEKDKAIYYYFEYKLVIHFPDFRFEFNENGKNGNP